MNHNNEQTAVAWFLWKSFDTCIFHIVWHCSLFQFVCVFFFSFILSQYQPPAFCTVCQRSRNIIVLLSIPMLPIIIHYPESWLVSIQSSNWDIYVTTHGTVNQPHTFLNLTIIFLSFRTDRSGQTVQTQIRLLLIRVYTVWNSLCIFWMHYS